MNSHFFDVPDWGGGDDFSYSMEASAIGELCSTPANIKLKKGKRKGKRKLSAVGLEVTEESTKIKITKEDSYVNKKKPKLELQSGPPQTLSKKKKKKINETSPKQKLGEGTNEDILPSQILSKKKKKKSNDHNVPAVTGKGQEGSQEMVKLDEKNDLLSSSLNITTSTTIQKKRKRRKKCKNKYKDLNIRQNENNIKIQGSMSTVVNTNGMSSCGTDPKPTSPSKTANCTDRELTGLHNTNLMNKKGKHSSQNPQTIRSLENNKPKKKKNNKVNNNIQDRDNMAMSPRSDESHPLPNGYDNITPENNKVKKKKKKKMEETSSLSRTKQTEGIKTNSKMKKKGGIAGNENLSEGERDAAESEIPVDSKERGSVTPLQESQSPTKSAPKKQKLKNKKADMIEHSLELGETESPRKKKKKPKQDSNEDENTEIVNSVKTKKKQKMKKNLEILNDASQNKSLPLKTKTKKENQREEDDSGLEEMIFEDDGNDDEECSPEFKSDFGQLLKQLNFDKFHSEMQTSIKGKRGKKQLKGNNFLSLEKEEMEENGDGEWENMDSEKEIESPQKSKKKKKDKKNTNDDKIPKIEQRKDMIKPVKKLEAELTASPKSAKNVKLTSSVNTSLQEVKEETKDSNAAKKKKKAAKGAKILTNDNINLLSASATSSRKAKFDREMLGELLDKAKAADTELSPPPTETLKQRMEKRLTAAKFRLLNEQLYSSSSMEAVKIFKSDPKSFNSYHQGYQDQVKCWPVSPLDLIVTWLQSKPKNWVIADLGCGEATLALRAPQTNIRSFDLVAANPRVTACDMSHVPLASGSVDVAVFCLSLMGTNISDFISEANRILREGGIMKIAEVESRFEDPIRFIKQVTQLGFHLASKDTSRKFFHLFEFKKNRKIKKGSILPQIHLKACVYKKR